MLTLKINCSEICTREDLYSSIAKQLPLPNWFGKNLDALHDTLTCDILPKDELCVDIIDADKLCGSLGEYAKAFFAMLEDIAEENERCKIRLK